MGRTPVGRGELGPLRGGGRSCFSPVRTSVHVDLERPPPRPIGVGGCLRLGPVRTWSPSVVRPALGPGLPSDSQPVGYVPCRVRERGRGWPEALTGSTTPEQAGLYPPSVLPHGSPGEVVDPHGERLGLLVVQDLDRAGLAERGKRGFMACRSSRQARHPPDSDLWRKFLRYEEGKLARIGSAPWTLSRSRPCPPCQSRHNTVASSLRACPVASRARSAIARTASRG